MKLHVWASENLDNDGLATLYDGMIDVEWIDDILDSGVSHNSLVDFYLLHHDGYEYPLVIVDGKLRAKGEDGYVWIAK
jgi:hypothetical protein